MKKRLLALLLSTVMVFGLVGCGNDGNNSNDNPATDTQQDGSEIATKPTEPTGQIVIGSSTNLENEWYDTSYNNTAFNYAAYSLIHGGSTIAYTKEGEWAVDETVVADFQATDNEDGSKTYTMKINDGLVWSDGSAITAKDYVFALLLESSPEMMGVDGYPANGYTVLVGYDEFNSGDTKNFAGVRLIDEMTFSITVKAEELPYHYDLAYASCGPRPMAVIAPGCDVVDSEEGASITGEFTTELLMTTINDTETGYRFNPQVVCGPYLLKEYDASSFSAVLEVNPNYAGDYRGVKPVIKSIVLKTVEDATMISELEAGTVDVLFELSGGETINAGLDLVDAGKVQKTTHFRNGYGKIAFDCSQFPTDSVNVRQAIALCLDRNEFARQYSGGYATIVHSAYGLAQWEAVEAKDWLNENLDTYDMDLDRAKQLLIDDGWTLNKDGEEYKDGDGLRYKEVDGELKPLQIEWCNTEGNPVSELLATMLPEAMTEVGMELLPTTVDFPTLSAAMSHQGEKIYNMYNLGTGFSSAHSPWYYYSSDEKWMTAGYNSNWIKDEELEATSGALQNIPYEDKETWLETWKTFIKTWNEKLPDIPLYSDEYHDFISNKVHDWDTSSIWGWESAVLDAWVSE